MRGKQAGFTLLETVMTLALTAVMLTVLLHYHYSSRQALEQQWQIQTLWRHALALTEQHCLDASEGWRQGRHVIPCEGCSSAEIIIQDAYGHAAALLAEQACRAN